MSNFIPKPKENHPRYQGARSLSFILSPLIKPICQQYGFQDARIILEWPRLVGDKFSNSAKLTKISFPSKSRLNGTLHITCSSSVALLLKYEQSIIIEKINRFYGYQAITFIKTFHENLKPIMIKPSPKSILENSVLPSLHDIPFSPLEEALLNLGKTLLKN